MARPDGKLIRGSDARWSKRAEEAFLLELTVSANVRAAARAAGFSGAAVYKRRLKDKRFAAAWDAAVETGGLRRRLQVGMQRRLVEGRARRSFPQDHRGHAHEGEVAHTERAMHAAGGTFQRDMVVRGLRDGLLAEQGG